MKKTFILSLWIIGVMFFVSCSKTPDNIIHKEETRSGDWVYNPTVGKPVQEQVTYYQIAPTLGQGISIASHRADHSGKLAMSIALGALFLFLLIGQFLHLNYVPRWFEENAFYNGVFNLILVGACIYFAIGDGIGVAFNNYKWVTKEKYDSAMNLGSTQSIWDEYEANYELVDGPYK
jgi:hypothetical protein